MVAAAIVCNVVLLAVTGLIVLGEGLPGAAPYLLLTLLMALVPLVSAVVLLRDRRALEGRGPGEGGSMAARARRATVLLNLVLLGASAWAAVAQYPYPEGDSLIPLAVLAVGTPALTLVALRWRDREPRAASPPDVLAKGPGGR